MDSSRLQGKIYKGYGKAAAKIGPLYSLYRPIDPLNPLGNFIREINASFNAKDWTYLKPNVYGQAQWYGVFDGRLTRVGDYLINSDNTYFIAAMQLDLSILCVQCNRVLSVKIQNSKAMTNNAFITIAQNVPVSILEATQSKGKLDGPESVGQGKYRLLMPSLGIMLKTNYILVDDLNQSYEVLSTELTDLGWRAILERVRT